MQHRSRIQLLGQRTYSSSSRTDRGSSLVAWTIVVMMMRSSEDDE